MIVHNSHDEFYRYPLTPVCCGEKVRLRLSYDGTGRVNLRTWSGSESIYPMKNIGDNTYECEIQAPDTPSQLWYCFYIDENFTRHIYGNNPDMLGGEGRVYESYFHSYLIVVYDKNFTTPEYLHTGNVYQIFPDRFRRGNYEPDSMVPGRTEREWHNEPMLVKDKANGDNYAHDFFMGNLRGIVEKLDYLYDLGIRTIYLNPIFKAGTNHRYDTGDYEQIDSYLGNNDEFVLLCDEAKKHGMHIMLDGVFSHSGNDSKYFNQKGTYKELGAYQSKESPYYKWYTFKQYPDNYQSWWGIYTLPVLNKNEPSLRNYMLNAETGIVAKWLKMGASAWRLDVADELPVDFLQDLRKTAKQTKADCAIVGEVWEDASAKASYGEIRCYCLGDTLDSVMNYPLRHAIIQFLTQKINAYDLERFINHQKEVYPYPFHYATMNILGSHDKARPLNVLCGEEHSSASREMNKHVKLSVEQYTLAYRRYIQAVALISALPGSPCIYYGDEAGVQGTADPWNRRVYPWGYEDRSLIREISAILNHRLENPLLQVGFMDAKAIDENTIQIRRYVDNSKDVFGRACENGEICFTLNRNEERFSWTK